MRSIRAYLSMYPKWLLVVALVFLVTFVLAITVFKNLTLIVLSLALLFGAYAVKEMKYNRLVFVICLFLCIAFVLLAIRTYPV